MRDDLVFHYNLARPVTFTRNHTSLVRFRQVRSAVAAPFGSVHRSHAVLGVFVATASPLRSGHRRVSGRVSAPAVPIPGALVALSSHAYSLSLAARSFAHCLLSVSPSPRSLDRRSDSLSPRAFSPTVSPSLAMKGLSSSSLPACGGDFLRQGSRPASLPAAAPRPSCTCSGAWRSSA